MNTMIATILLIAFTIIVGLVISVMINTATDKALEKSCIDSGGSIIEASCCKSIGGNFPSSCYMGQCGCSQENSHKVKYCECGSDKCFIKEQGCVLP